MASKWGSSWARSRPEMDSTTVTSRLRSTDSFAAFWICINADHKVEEPSCDAARLVGLERVDTKASACDAPVAGKLLPVVLIRTLQYAAATIDELSCADPSVLFPEAAKMTTDAGETFYECADVWVVHLKKK